MGLINDTNNSWIIKPIVQFRKRDNKVELGFLKEKNSGTKLKKIFGSLTLEELKLLHKETDIFLNSIK